MLWNSSIAVFSQNFLSLFEHYRFIPSRLMAAVEPGATQCLFYSGIYQIFHYCRSFLGVIGREKFSTVTGINIAISLISYFLVFSAVSPFLFSLGIYWSATLLLCEIYISGKLIRLFFYYWNVWYGVFTNFLHILLK